jgi:hypothetical protein
MPTTLPDNDGQVYDGCMNVSVGEAVLILIVYVLAVASVTRLINGDKITDRLRLYPAEKLRAAQQQHALNTNVMAGGDQALIERSERSIRRWDAVVYFLSCPWCVSMWIALPTAIVPVFCIGWPWWALFPVAFATRHLVGVFARFADTEEIEIEDGPTLT